MGCLPADPGSVATPRVAPRFAHVEVLVVGEGRRGPRRRACGVEDGDRVLLVDEHPSPGRTSDRVRPHGPAERDRARRLRRRVRRAARTIQPRASCGTSGPAVSVLATGALEQRIALAGNDLPGVHARRGDHRVPGTLRHHPQASAPPVFRTNQWGFGITDVFAEAGGIDVVRTIDAAFGGARGGGERQGPSRSGSLVRDLRRRRGSASRSTSDAVSRRVEPGPSGSGVLDAAGACGSTLSAPSFVPDDRAHRGSRSWGRQAGDVPPGTPPSGSSKTATTRPSTSSSNATRPSPTSPALDSGLRRSST